MGRGSFELAQTLLCVALAWHFVGSSTPNGLRVNNSSEEGLSLLRRSYVLPWPGTSSGEEGRRTANQLYSFGLLRSRCSRRRGQTAASIFAGMMALAASIRLWLQFALCADNLSRAGRGQPPLSTGFAGGALFLRRPALGPIGFKASRSSRRKINKVPHIKLKRQKQYISK